MHTSRMHFQAMGCLNELLVATEDEALASAAMAAAVEEVRRIETRYSRYRPDSLISQINACAGSGTFIACDAEANWLLGFADLLFQQSGGLFDITSGVLRQAWNFREPAVPNDAQLQPLLQRIGWQQVERSEAGVRLPVAGMEIDFGGFAKEFAADRAARVLQQQGIRHGYVNLGGDICAIGPQPDGTPWLIGISNPREPGAIIATIPVYQGALATSGDYERFFELDGKRYCHVMNPRTGQPVTFWRSVTVLAPLCIAAGACTTLAMLKEAEGLQYLHDSGFSFLAVDAHGEILSTRQ